MCTPKIYIFLLYCITDCLIYFFTIFNRNIYNFIFLNQLFCITRNTNLLSVTSSSYRKREIVIFVNFGELKDLYTSERSGMCSVFFMVCWRYVFVGYKWNSLVLVSRKCCAKVGFLDIFFWHKNSTHSMSGIKSSFSDSSSEMHVGVFGLISFCCTVGKISKISLSSSFAL